MNINSISNTVGNAIGGKYKKREMSNFKDNLDTVIKNAPKFDTYIPEEKLYGMDNSGVDNREVNEDACKNILKNGNSKELEKEQFWQGIFQILDKDSEQQATKTESTTDSKVVVKADGSRVLMITINVNGIKMTMSLEISKPSDTTTLNASDLQSVNSEL